jgi:hypothetical protein
VAEVREDKYVRAVSPITLSSIVSADSESVKLRTSPIAATLPPLTANLTTPLEPLVVAMIKPL